MPTLETLPPATWQVDLATGDIVLFRFHYPDAPTAERARPCLVVEVDAAGGEAAIVGGTFRRSAANRGQELHVTGPDIQLTLLDCLIRVVGTRRVRVLRDNPHFVIGTRGTSVVGRLPETARAPLDRLKHPQAPSRRRAAGLRRRRSNEAGPSFMLHRSPA